MSLLPPPFQNSDAEGQSFSPATFFTNNSTQEARYTVKAGHYLPWYSGSEGNSKIHQHLSQNRAVQLGVPPIWKSVEGRNSDYVSEWSDPSSSTPQWNPGSGSNYRKFGSFKSKANISFYCDACNRGFGTQEELGEHQATHIKCPFARCTFMAHPKVVALHQKLQHSSGLAEKMVCLDTPEGIRRWREERKRNFPTAANIERKKREEAEKLARGEELRDKYFGKMRQNNVGLTKGNVKSGTEPCQNGRKGRGRGRKRHRNRGANAKKGTAVDATETQSQRNAQCPVRTDDKQQEPSLNGCNPAAGHTTLGREEAAKEGNESEEESTQRRKRCSSPMAALSMGGSLSLLAGYGSGSDSNQEEDCKPERDKKRPRLLPKPVPDLYPSGCNWQPSGRRRQSLLEKLLASDIRHERNLILQCVHYAVKCNFFDNTNQ